MGLIFFLIRGFFDRIWFIVSDFFLIYFLLIPISIIFGRYFRSTEEKWKICRRLRQEWVSPPSVVVPRCRTASYSCIYRLLLSSFVSLWGPVLGFSLSSFSLLPYIVLFWRLWVSAGCRSLSRGWVWMGRGDWCRFEDLMCMGWFHGTAGGVFAFLSCDWLCFYCPFCPLSCRYSPFVHLPFLVCHLILSLVFVPSFVSVM